MGLGVSVAIHAGIQAGKSETGHDDPTTDIANAII